MFELLHLDLRHGMQYPLTNLGLHSGFTVINIVQAVVLLPLFLFAFFMYRWENSDLVPIR